MIKEFPIGLIISTLIKNVKFGEDGDVIKVDMSPYPTLYAFIPGDVFLYADREYLFVGKSISIPVRYTQHGDICIWREGAKGSEIIDARLFLRGNCGFEKVRHVNL